MFQGGPIIMASNVQKQQQSIRKRRPRNAKTSSTTKATIKRITSKEASITTTTTSCTTSKAGSKTTAAAAEASKQQHFKLSHCKLRTATYYSLLQFVLLLVFFSSSSSNNVALAEGNVGCHFVRTLCLEGSEVCFNDNIFGKCIPTTGVDVEDIERNPLSEEQSRLLATMLEELQGAGLGWDHPYVQCRIQGTLYSLQKQTQLPPNLCANLAPNPSEIDPAGALAIVRFTPPNEDYADELYYPPLKKQLRNGQALGLPRDNGINAVFHQLQLQDRQLRHDPLELAHFGKHDKEMEVPNVMNAFLETERARIEREEMERQAELEAERKQTLKNRLELYQMLAASEPDPQPYQRQKGEEEEPEAAPLPPALFVADELANEDNEFYFPDYAPFKRTGGNARKYQQPHSFFRELAHEQQAKQQQPEVHEQKRIPSDLDEMDPEIQLQLAYQEGLRRNSLTPFEEEAMLSSNMYPYHKAKHYKPERVFTEGGLVYMPDNEEQMSNDEEDLQKEKAAEILANVLGFTRHERLDVKKPGPLIGPPGTDVSKVMLKNKTETKELLPMHIKQSNEINKKKKVIQNQHSEEDHAVHTVDTEYAHVFVKNPIDSWNDGTRIVNELANILHMQGYFTYLTVQPHEVSFRVDSNNPERKNATDIARIINENKGVKNNLLRRLGVTVVRAGVGDKIKRTDDGEVSASRLEIVESSPDVTHIMAYMFAGAGVASVVVIFVTLVLIKRHDKTRDKLGGLQSGIAGVESCSKDYQDLCRARMAGKGNATEPAASGRIASLSKETDRPPSSRSSTSSWSEEPALTNMDISTGHMVLSYMEDHLRNKGRLQREWEALCRYEAEPSAREAAQQPQCANFNRNGAPLPYDHSRVVLNHLANAEGFDYINASTITDHDPRAPAYVAAQGPLPTTLSHFWQMIWEQGAVVIVSLCRLQENGDVACARYWPEEGAEVYHIYEVHLVSEHIWCDDYLVRSFYLKNLRTSETRTVTQFHFLSWPQGGVPAQAKALLDFRRKVNKSYRGRSCPIVVHGSAGAGRTGAYILLDLVLGRMNKGAREIDIAATLEHLRDQRAGLVANRQQFEFVLMAVAEEVHAILKALPANQTNEKRELDKDKDNTITTTAAAATTGGVLKEEAESGEETASTSKIAAAEIKAMEKDKDKTTNKNEKETKATPSKGASKKK